MSGLPSLSWSDFQRTKLIHSRADPVLTKFIWLLKLKVPKTKQERAGVSACPVFTCEEVAARHVWLRLVQEPKPGMLRTLCKEDQLLVSLTVGW